MEVMLARHLPVVEDGYVVGTLFARAVGSTPTRPERHARATGRVGSNGAWACRRVAAAPELVAPRERPKRPPTTDRIQIQMSS
jgi:hypothetical protein